jgi:hypothetical protein
MVGNQGFFNGVAVGLNGFLDIPRPFIPKSTRCGDFVEIIRNTKIPVHEDSQNFYIQNLLCP